MLSPPQLTASAEDPVHITAQSKPLQLALIPIHYLLDSQCLKTAQTHQTYCFPPPSTVTELQRCGQPLSAPRPMHHQFQCLLTNTLQGWLEVQLSGGALFPAHV